MVFIEQEKDKYVVGHLREIIKPFILRRLKVDVCPDIPPKKEVVIYASTTDLQRELYTATLNHNQSEILSVHAKRRCAARRNYNRIHTDPYAELYEAAVKKYRDADNNKKLQVEKHGLIICPTNDVGQRRNDEELIKASGKFIILDAMLKKLHAGGHKVLIYSTWVQILDHIEDYLKIRPWNWTRLDGSRKIKDRQYNIDLFNNDPSLFLFLMTTRAGGVGLNLMGADTLIIFDSDWNPQADIQAMARCHRIGQTRPVIIYKLCIKGSYDELIINRANAKKKLEKLVISEDLNGVPFDKDMLLKMKQLLEKTEHEVVQLKLADLYKLPKDDIPMAYVLVNKKVNTHFFTESKML
ncbi:LOW QUALITY PROTEIN: lymphoid-specific helicase-like [Aphidius gifuensis]|uniref:LOW QUALITY PROTEIN: lymphoid-specific helicase-like n=1 Tax=Aphidius gifuensis TaxID=684658 RepID=UPI001CDD5367|nr:LOW QUALITY PROTEIN: lymphoid-specific helicase-like [Aphidius gifuensis]